MPYQGLLVVSEKDSHLVGRELEESRVVCPEQSSVLGPHDVEIGNLPLESAEDPAVEILVGQESEHWALTPKAGEEPVAQAGLCGMGLDLATQGRRSGAPLPKINIHLVAVAQVVG